MSEHAGQAGRGGPGGRSGRAGTLRAATFNIHHGASADDHLDLARTAAEIRALDADVVGLQEVDVAFGDRSAGEDQARALAEMLGMDVAFAPAIDRPGTDPDGPRRQYGVALLVRGRILESETHLLPAAPGLGPLREPRAVLCASVRTARDEAGPADASAGNRSDPADAPASPDLTVLVTHLDTERPEHRRAQIGRILEVAARRAQDLHGSGVDASDVDGSAAPPALLLGDMNADQSAPEMRLLAASGWRDAALEASGRAPVGGGRDIRTSDGEVSEVRAIGGASAAGRVGRTLTAALRSPAFAVATTAVVSAASNVLAAVVSRLPGTGRTVGAGVRGSFPAVFPVRRIDGIWVHGPLVARAVEVPPGKASDHRAVVATLEDTGPA
ncbi:endonuclease/exonuclease/phosphatase family protein [Brachybacterium sp. ACRRE]|uniref:endonuclease/exonuclease/phosphatase family protein n=1 Tax=Brachybacterium sp. ACRRE TaxID=2918184 RepID=UPI001EF3BFFE|nr:endonuclease/exonuclease/phosphatase family protein [Brachybacterium sp. ACRRE]MCG7311368.1 endonuclease/exonuclease/phosphatase family protein [Brachybacterium sp. ACRRE]